VGVGGRLVVCEYVNALITALFCPAK